MSRDKKYIIGMIAVVVVIGALVFVEKARTSKETANFAFENPPLGDAIKTNDYYVRQLTPAEYKVYTQITTAIEENRGGVITFSEGLTGPAYARINQCLTTDTQNTFNSILFYPMTGDNQDITALYENLMSVNKPEIKKAFIYLWGAEFDPKDVKVENGTVVNVEACDQLLKAISPERAEEVEKLKVESLQILDGVVQNMPQDLGQAEAVDYFVNWMHENLAYAEEEWKSFTTGTNLTVEDNIELYRIPSDLTCVIEGKVLGVGYAKTLAYLCNKVGIEASVRAGNLANYGAHTLTAITIAGRTGYIDPSGVWAANYGEKKIISPIEADNRMPSTNGFE